MAHDWHPELLGNNSARMSTSDPMNFITKDLNNHYIDTLKNEEILSKF